MISKKKIGEEIKCIRIEKDAKKRREFLHTYIIRARICREMAVGRIAGFCNAVIKFDFEQEIHDKIHATMETKNGPLFFVKTMGVFYTQIKEKILFYYIQDGVKCRNFYKECVDGFDPEVYNWTDSDSDDSSEDSDSEDE